MITRYRKESRASTFGLAAVVTVLALLTFTRTSSSLAAESRRGLPAGNQRTFTTDSRLTFDKKAGQYLVVAKVSELIAGADRTVEKLIAAPRMTVVAGRGGRITDTQADGTSVSAEIAWPESDSEGPATFIVTLLSRDKVLTRSKFEFELPGVSGSMAESQSPQNVGALAEARRVILPQFKVEGVAFPEALIELMAAGERNHPEHRRILMGAFGELQDLRITLDLENVTLADAVEQLARSAGCDLHETHAGNTDRNFLYLMSRTLKIAGP